MQTRGIVSACGALVLIFGTFVSAADWPRFRGPNGAGISIDEKPTPVTWSETENLKWKVALPGPGHSSPIVVGDRVFVTCWTGYGVDRRNPGDQQQLKRVLLCLDRNTGTTLWSKSVDAVLPEERYGGMFAEHGYATHTPASDGERVYAFFGKSGVFAFDLDGKQLWQAGVGTDLDPRAWGSSSSPILYKNLLIVTASIESHALVALDKTTGKEVWRKEADGFGDTWGTPILVDLPEGRQEIVLGVPFEIWAFDPDTGRLNWYCEALSSNSMCSSVIADGGVVYAAESGPGGGGTIAVRAGGKGDVTQTHVLWRGRDQNRIGTPIVHDGRLHWISSKIANCIDAATGARIYQSRLGSSTAPVPPGREGERPRFGGGFGGGRGGGQDYSSPVVADGKIYYVTRGGDMYVLALGPEFKLLAQNRLASDDGDFSATPAISNGELFVRSTKNLYCVGGGGK